MEVINALNLSSGQWLGVIMTALLIGFSRTGLRGLVMPAAPFLAAVFGGRESTGIILPLLIVGDAFALYYYRRHADWGNLKKLLPWTYIGLMVGALTGSRINDKEFKVSIAILIIFCLFILIYMDKKGDHLKVPGSAWFFVAMGVLSGFASMIGNAAGPIFSVYLLAFKLRKNGFMGTSAWFFFIVNVSKVPLQIFFWNNIHMWTLVLTIVLVPSIFTGAFLGNIVMKKCNEKQFRILIIILTAVTAVNLLI